MENKTNLKVPKKYQIAIEEVQKDCTGYWIWLKEDYISSETGCHTIHEYTQKDALKALQTIVKVENNK